MDNNRKSDLISALAGEFYGTGGDEIRVNTTNYIPETISIDSTATGLDLDTLIKTKNVIAAQIAKFSNSTDQNKAQLLSHLKVAKKCVEEVIAIKNKKAQSD